MPRLPRLRGRESIAALRRVGFGVLRIRGSHHFLQHPDGRRTVVSVRAGEAIGPGLLSKILTGIDMDAETLSKWIWWARRTDRSGRTAASRVGQFWRSASLASSPQNESGFTRQQHTQRP